ncbi:MAG: hypothetical protein H2172_11430 [Opitutus sp.]|nr:hypothetical protein [Opitutus sp.]MCS6248181.1 hypothetical protein [Opitutus sp.]MCS6273441.1 hypothetical protein [Opitutus sp.]MCS6276959.1 hypothetical protein [Opitutus sp.]MCS6299993.1 hypothetical protein [Opitutus sp.]
MAVRTRVKSGFGTGRRYGRARDAFSLIPTVAQPLWAVLEERADIEAALADPNRVRPIHGHYHARRSVPELAVR